MTISQQRSRFEARISSAHRSVYSAAQIADELGYEGAVRALHELEFTLRHLLEDSLSSNKSALARLKHGDNVPF